MRAYWFLCWLIQLSPVQGAFEVERFLDPAVYICLSARQRLWPAWHFANCDFFILFPEESSSKKFNDAKAEKIKCVEAVLSKNVSYYLIHNCFSSKPLRWQTSQVFASRDTKFFVTNFDSYKTI